MIIELILNALYNAFSLLTTSINIPNMPDGVLDILMIGFEYISAGVGILGNYTYMDINLTFLGVVLAIDLGVAIYHFVMWIIRKIPMLGMS